MFDDMKTKGALKKINEGGTAELSKSQIVLSLVNLNAVFKPLRRDDFTRMPKEDKKIMNSIIDWYKELRADKTKETYDKAKLDEVSKQILDELAVLQGPTREQVEEEVKANDEDVKQAEKIDLDNFFGDDEPEDDNEPEDEDGSEDDNEPENEDGSESDNEPREE